MKQSFESFLNRIRSKEERLTRNRVSRASLFLRTERGKPDEKNRPRYPRRTVPDIQIDGKNRPRYPNGWKEPSPISKGGTI